MAGWDDQLGANHYDAQVSPDRWCLRQPGVDHAAGRSGNRLPCDVPAPRPAADRWWVGGSATPSECWRRHALIVPLTGVQRVEMFGIGAIPLRTAIGCGFPDQDFAVRQVGLFQLSEHVRHILG